MSHIKVNTSELSDYRSSMASTACDIYSVADKVENILSSLDWQVKAKENVSQSLTEIKKSVRKGHEQIERYNSAVSSTIERFTEMDTATAADINGANNMINALTEIAANMPDISNIFSTAEASSIFDKIKEIFDLPTLVAMTGTTGGFAAVLAALASSAAGQKFIGNTTQYYTSTDLWTILKDKAAAVSGAGALADAIEALGGETTFGDLVDDIKGSSIIKGVGYVSDAETAITAVINGDMDALGELGEKYAKKGVKSILETTCGLGSLEAGAYVNLGAEFFENLLDIDEYAGINSSYSAVGGLAAYMWHVTGGTFADYGVNTGLSVIKGAEAILHTDYFTSVYETVDTKGVYSVWSEIADGAKDIFSDNSFGDGVSLIWDSTKDYFSGLFK